MDNKVRNWSITGIVLTILTGLGTMMTNVGTNLITEWLKPSLPGGSDTARPAREERGEEQRRSPAPVVKPDRSGHKTIESSSISAPEGDD